MKAPRGALIVRLSSIGDVVHTLPAFSAMRAAWPETRLGWAVEPAAAPLVRALPGPLDVHTVDTAKWRRRLWHPATWNAMRSSMAALRTADYDIALDFQGLIKSALVARQSGARVYGLAREDVREKAAALCYDETAAPVAADAHITERSLGLARAAGAATHGVRFPRTFGDDDLAYVEGRLAERGVDRFALAHGAANWSSKTWPLRHQAAAGRQIHHATGLPILWIWGPGERHLAGRISAAAGVGNRPAFPTTLPQLSALLSRASLFIGGDSAPLHLAVANGTPTVAFFGPTSPARFGPIDSADISVASQQPCSFCHRRRCPLGTRACLETLTPETVAQAAADRLATSMPRAG